jgi:hypothetical protein
MFMISVNIKLNRKIITISVHRNAYRVKKKMGRGRGLSWSRATFAAV